MGGDNYAERNRVMDKILLLLIGCTMVIFIHRGWKDIKEFWVEFLIAGVFLLSVLLYRKWSQKRKKVEK
jgi:hypothetical protein